MENLEVKEERASEKLEEIASELFETVELRKELEGTEKELKGFFHKLLPEGGEIQAGKYRVLVAAKQRTGLSFDLVEKLLGKDKTKACIRTTPYLEVTVREKRPPSPLLS